MEEAIESTLVIATQQANTEVVATDIPPPVRNLKWMIRNTQQSGTGPTHEIIIFTKILEVACEAKPERKKEWQRHGYT